ncbi:Vacuolar protein sorting-associated protein 26B [Lobulomyces angularis]|nr:Vacuolar protein sorting-associated protein 26B [Lobulomyces angularis]
MDLDSNWVVDLWLQILLTNYCALAVVVANFIFASIVLTNLNRVGKFTASVGLAPNTNVRLDLGNCWHHHVFGTGVRKNLNMQQFNIINSNEYQSIFGLGTQVDIEIAFNEDENSLKKRSYVDVKTQEKQKQKFPLYFDGEAVSGKVMVRVKDGKKLEHQGIKIEFVGHIELFYDRGNHYEFASLTQELAAPGELRQNATYDFEFKNVEKQYESYFGINVKLRYFVRVTVGRRLSDVTKEKDIFVHSYKMPPETNASIKMEVGIEDCLHIEFEYNKNKYHLRDVIVGKIYFLLVRIKIKHMELSIIRRETTGAAPNQYNESETITKFEIMDGAPVRGETIPIRLFLSGFELTPTYKDVNKKFSTRYYLNLVLIDEENRRYFKQQEISIYRLKESDNLIPGLSSVSLES